MINDGDCFSRFLNVQIGTSGDKRAPHKPLLLLWAIGRCLRNKERLVSYELIDRELSRLMRRFGPHGRSFNTHYPFWRLQNDSIWEVENAHLVRTTKSGDAYRNDLLRFQVRGGLAASVYTILRNSPVLALRIVEALVGRHFPPSIHDEVLEASSIPFSTPYLVDALHPDEYLRTTYRRRDPKFRSIVLSAYESACAVCEFSGQFFDRPLGIEAAHIQWHESKGPAVVENGLALCALHHRLFDAGAFTVLPDLTIKVSPEVQGDGIDRALGQYDSFCLRAPPSKQSARPAPEYLLWHIREVFKSPEILGSL